MKILRELKQKWSLLQKKMPNNLQKMMRTIVLTKITIIIIQQKMSTWDKKLGHKACDKFIHIMTVWHLYWYI